MKTKTDFVDESGKNAFKTLLIMACLSGLIVAIGYAVAVATNNPSYITYALIASIGQVFISYFMGPTIALSSAGAEKADPNKYTDLHRIVEEVAKEAGIDKPEVHVISDPAPNAFATGTSRSNAHIAVTTGIMAMLDRGELSGVIAHEMTHIKNRDMLVMTSVVAMSSVLSTLANMAMYSSMNRDNREGGNGILLAIGMLGSIVMPFALMIIQMAISRKREFMADAGGAIITSHPESLANALRKIGNYKQPLQNATPATAHMYISCPFGGTEYQSFWQKLFMTHPPIEDRVRALMG